MSWFVNSLANSLKLDDPDRDRDLDHNNNNPNSETDNNNNNNDSSPTPNRGVKDDLTELSKTFTRQLWGVASFLAPPPPPTAADADVNDGGDAATIAGIRNDLSEIGGKFKTEISKLKGVSELTKIATSLLHFGDDGDLSVQDFADRGVVGVTDEVVGFVRDVAMHPETWLDFPLPDDFDEDEDDEDFDLSDAQQEHALAVERLAPELAALRTELCLGYMTEGSFWKIYFVLVHPRLSRHDAAILSTPPIMQARAMLTQELQNRGKSRKSGSGNEEQLSVPIVDQSESVPVEIIPADPAPPAPSVQHDVVMDKHSIASTEELVIEKAVVEEVPRKYTVREKSKNVVSVDEKDEDEDEDEDEDDEWLKEETEATSFKGTPNPLTSHDDEDVSFSDLEEDDDA